MLNNNYNKTLTNSIKKKIQSIFKNIGYSLSKAFYGHIKGVIESKNNQSIELIEKTLEKDYLYKIYIIKNCRLYTDTVNDAAFIIKDKIIEIVAAKSDKMMSTHLLSNKSANRPTGSWAINPPNKKTVIRIAISSLIKPIAFP